MSSKIKLFQIKLALNNIISYNCGLQNTVVKYCTFVFYRKSTSVIKYFTPVLSSLTRLIFVSVSINIQLICFKSIYLKIFIKILCCLMPKIFSDFQKFSVLKKTYVSFFFCPVAVSIRCVRKLFSLP